MVTPQAAISPPDTCRALEAPLSRERAEEVAFAVKALAEPARLQILSILRSLPDRTACSGEFVKPLGLAAATVSHHLKVLHEAGLLVKERRGPWIYYRLPGDRLNDLCATILE